MKQCPGCGSGNQDTNLFCPECGHSFLDAEAPGPRDKGRDGPNGRVKAAVVLMVVVLGLAAGVTSFFISREIERRTLVTVRHGTVWECAKCGKTYREHVASVNVPKSDREMYGVETIEGECLTCRFGEEVGTLQEALDTVADKGLLHGTAPEISETAARFIAANPGLYPSGDTAAVEALATGEDPRRVEKDFAAYAGRPIAVSGRVTAVEEVTGADGRSITVVQMVPVVGGDEVQVELVLIYHGECDLLKGDSAAGVVLPLDVVRYDTGQAEFKAIVAAAMSLWKEPPAD